GLKGLDRERAIINIFTRIGYCTPRGRIAFEEKNTPGTQQPGLYPWYEVPGHATRDLKIVCGHWCELGLFIGHGVHAIDTGAVWGVKLTALQLDTDELRIVQVPGHDAGLTEQRAGSDPPYADIRRYSTNSKANACRSSAGCDSREATCQSPSTYGGKNATASSTTVSTWVRCIVAASGNASAYTCAPPITHNSAASSARASASASSSAPTASTPSNGMRPPC